ncbi:MAG TPA: hypothetical protein VKH35_11755, partial [Thermoanaerobaculia bacterium]|nr:hypothetical protein [Thermoanaerobaculia bacterium]
VLFPIISPSDDINAIQTLNDAAATLVVIMELVVAFFAIERLRAMRMRAFTVHVAIPTDPRSPPAR